MKKEASDLEAKVEKMMMEKVRASSPPRSSLRWASSARPERCWAAAGLDIVGAAQDKALSKMEADIDVEALKLRELRGKMVEAGIYKSWCAPPAPPPIGADRSVGLTVRRGCRHQAVLKE